MYKHAISICFCWIAVIFGNPGFAAVVPPWTADSYCAALFHWDDPFDDGDVSGNGAVFSGGSNFSWSDNGRFGGSMQFFPRSSTSAAKSQISLNAGLFNNVFSIDCWVWFNGTPPQGFGNVTIGRPMYVLSSSNVYIRYNADNQHIEFGIKPGSTWAQAASDSSMVIAPETWYYLCCVYDGSQIKLYINGALAGSASKTGSLSQNTYTVGGVGWANELSSELNGYIDEVRFSTNSRFGSYQAAETEVQTYPVAKSATAIVRSMRGQETPPASLVLRVYNTQNQLLREIPETYSGRFPVTKYISLGQLLNSQNYRLETWLKWPDNSMQMEKTQSFAMPSRPVWADCNEGQLNGAVLKPWTPIQTNGSSLLCWNRMYDLGDSFVPVSISSGGQAILSDRINLVVESATQTVNIHSADAPAAISLSPTGDFAAYSASAQSNLCDVSIQGKLEFDGFMSVVLDLTPKTQLQTFAVEIPLANDLAKFIEPLSAAVYSAGAIPSGGVQLDPSYSLWLCNETAGLYFLCDSKQNWVAPSGQAIQVTRRGSDTLLRINFFKSSSQTFNSSRRYKFYLQATPIRPYNSDWFSNGSRMVSGINWGGNAVAQENDTVLTLPLPNANTFPTGAFEIIVQNYNYLNEIVQMPYNHWGCNENILDIISGSNKISLLFDKQYTNGMTLQTPWVNLGAAANCVWEPNQIHKLAFTWGDKLRFYVDGVLQASSNVTGFPMPNAQINLGSVTARYRMLGLRVSKSIDLASLSSTAPMASNSDTLLIYNDPLELRSNARTGLNVFKEAGTKTLIMFEHWADHENMGTSIYEPMIRNIVEDCHRVGLKFCLYWGFNLALATANEGTFAECKNLINDLPWWDPVRNERMYITTYGSPYQEYLLYHMKRLKDKIGIDGAYLDGTFGIVGPSDNPAFGSGYIDDNEVRQPTIPVDRIRQLAKRMNNIFMQNDDGVLWAHLGVSVPTMGFASNYYYGEHLIGAFNDPSKNILQIIPPDTAKCIWNGQNTGVPATLCAWQNGRITAGPYADLIGFGQLAVATDGGNGEMSEFDASILKKLQKLTLFTADTTQWYPYWETESVIPSSPANAIITSIYKRVDGAMAMALMNVTGQTVNGWIDLSSSSFSPPAYYTAKDLVTGAPIALTNGRLSVSLPAYGGMMIVVGSAYPPGDYNHDGTVDFSDLSGLVPYWLYQGCTEFDCQEIDLNNDAVINLKDIAVLGQYWLLSTQN